MNIKQALRLCLKKESLTRLDKISVPYRLQYLGGSQNRYARVAIMSALLGRKCTQAEAQVSVVKGILYQRYGIAWACVATMNDATAEAIAKELGLRVEPVSRFDDRGLTTEVVPYNEPEPGGNEWGSENPEEDN